jgi:hypothetical protein
MSAWRVKLEVIVTMTGVTGDYFTDSSCVQRILDIPLMPTTATGEIYILLTLAQVRGLILGKQQSEEGVATVWLTTAEMGFSLTEEPNEILCPKDIREGKGSDRFLARAISRFVTSTLAGIGGGTDRDQQAKDVWRELVHLHQWWGKISKITEGDNIRAQACNDANASGQFTRIVQRKNLPWEKDSIARVAYDPMHIQDCNVQ